MSSPGSGTGSGASDDRDQGFRGDNYGPEYRPRRDYTPSGNGHDAGPTRRLRNLSPFGGADSAGNDD
ncbi:MAG: hypothetical protein LBV34_09310, partial [Nocardiopsaceae bacterium]|nr:hypothetical protein [Nocardiopsaceae bacterium]